MASNLRVDTILPSTGTTLGIGTASGTINFLGNSNITTTGTISAASLSVTGSLGIGGTLTYEDVTNIDSVGVITARDGLRVTGIATISGAAKVGGGVDITTAGSGVFYTPGQSTASGINFHNSDLRFFTSNTERVRITSGGDLNMANGTASLKKHAVGIGTTTLTGRNAGVGTAIGQITYNTTENRIQIFTINNRWKSISAFEEPGYYSNLTAASADGMSHYWPGNSSTSLISNLSANQTTGSPVVNVTSGSYAGGSYPYFDFYTGNANENGYRYTQTTAKWADGPFTIAFWIQPMASTLEAESTMVQLGDHPSGTLRCLYSVSTDASRQCKAITIGDDVGATNSAVLSTSWQHWATVYDGTATKYYLNGSLAVSHNHSGTLDVGTGTKYIYIGIGYWNSQINNKASMSHMSDIGIWNAKALTATEVNDLYIAKRTVSGY